MNLQPAPAIVVNEAQRSEPVHEKAHPGTGCAHHLCQRLLADLGDHSFRLALLAKVSQQQKNSSQPFFAGIEQLIHQIFFVTDVSRQR